MHDDSYPDPSGSRDEVDMDAHSASDSDSDADLDSPARDLLDFPDDYMIQDLGSNEGSSVADDAEEEIFITLPNSLTLLREELLEGYKCPINPPDAAPMLHTLTTCQRLSLKH
jgi:hypothetical protein